MALPRTKASGVRTHEDTRVRTHWDETRVQTSGGRTIITEQWWNVKRLSVKMLSAISFVLWSLALVSCVRGENPAVQLALTDKGLQTVRHFAAGVIQDTLSELELPEVSGHIMGVHYFLSGMKVTKLDFPEPEVHFCPLSSGLKLSVIGLSVALTGDWRTHVGFIYDQGTFNLAVFDLSLNSVLGLDMDSSGRLSVSSVSCYTDIQSVDMHFYGGASWVFQWLVTFFQDHIRDRIQNKICPCVDSAIEGLERYLQALNVSVDVNSVMDLDLPLTDPPTVDSDSVNFGLKGEFYCRECHKDPPFVAPSFFLPVHSDYMLSVGVSEYSVNSASFAYYISGHLQALVNDSMIPPYCPIRLNTTSMGRFIPQLVQLFPDLLMVLQVYARQTPMFSFESGFVKLDLNSAVKAFVVQANKTLTPIFKLHVDSALRGKMWVDSEKVKSSVKMDNFTLSLASTEIGPFQTDKLESIAKVGAGKAVDMLNKYLAKGFDLPQTRCAQLLNSVLSVEEGFIVFYSDAKFQSPF
ncbi:bactericidal permeability-increasing protein isoform X2 [Boleophthalmus pectinirostris]|uniref:bactericidal permeability-increasing protein isoform X2 n=1 Tax=Boleophthalmus pectinirostris TaxID=150288 RepID=UPI00242F6E3C|nr:bactericidal permeability-increasing protein isoform X2 [Boleophthalmus pectinirostris]